MIPATSRSSVVLPEPLRPTRPTASPGSTANETSRSAQTSVAAEPAAGDEHVLQRPRRASGRRGSVRSASSTRISPGFTPPTVARSSRRDERRRARARTRARRSASRSASNSRPSSSRALRRLDVEVPRISRWSETKPTGQTSTRSTPCAVQRVEVVEDVRPEPRLAGRGLALERERPVVEPGRARRRGARVSSSWSLYGSPSARIRAGSECAVKTTCASVPRTRSASSSTKPGSSCQLSTKRELGAARERRPRAGRGSPRSRAAE